MLYNCVATLVRCSAAESTCEACLSGWNWNLSSSGCGTWKIEVVENKPSNWFRCRSAKESTTSWVQTTWNQTNVCDVIQVLFVLQVQRVEWNRFCFLSSCIKCTVWGYASTLVRQLCQWCCDPGFTALFWSNTQRCLKNWT